MVLINDLVISDLSTWFNHQITGFNHFIAILNEWWVLEHEMCYSTSSKYVLPLILRVQMIFFLDNMHLPYAKARKLIEKLAPDALTAGKKWLIQFMH